jgi:hypothetical protein
MVQFENAPCFSLPLCWWPERMGGMEGDPKNPNAWWAIKLPSFLVMFPSNLSKSQKRRLYWLVPLIFIMESIGIFFVYKLVK